MNTGITSHSQNKAKQGHPSFFHMFKQAGMPSLCQRSVFLTLQYEIIQFSGQ